MSFTRVSKKITRPSSGQPVAPKPGASDQPTSQVSPVSIGSKLPASSTSSNTSKSSAYSGISSQIRETRGSNVLARIGGVSTASTTIRGTRGWVNNQVLTSIGLPQLDTVLGGGIPVGSLVCMSPDTNSSLHQQFSHAFIAEGLLHGHAVAVGLSHGKAFSEAFVLAARASSKKATAMYSLAALEAYEKQMSSKATATAVPASDVNTVEVKPNPIGSNKTSSSRQSKFLIPRFSLLSAVVQEGNEDEEDEDEGDVSKTQASSTTDSSKVTRSNRYDENISAVNTLSQVTILVEKEKDQHSDAPSTSKLSSTHRNSMKKNLSDDKIEEGENEDEDEDEDEDEFGMKAQNTKVRGDLSFEKEDKDFYRQRELMEKKEAQKSLKIAWQYDKYNEKSSLRKSSPQSSIFKPSVDTASLQPSKPLELSPMFYVPVHSTETKNIWSKAREDGDSSTSASNQLSAGPGSLSKNIFSRALAQDPSLLDVSCSFSLRQHFETVIEGITTVLRESNSLLSNPSSVRSLSTPKDEESDEIVQDSSEGSSSTPPNVCRLVISPLDPIIWPSLPVSASNKYHILQSEFSRFIIQLRALTRASRSIIWLNLPCTTSPLPPSFVQRVVACADVALGVSSFSSSLVQTSFSSAFGEFDGMLTFYKLARQNSLQLSYQLPETMQYLFKMRSRGLDIQKLSLPPEISRTTATEDPKTVLNHHQHQHQHQHGSCGCNHNSNANTSTTKSLKTPSAGLGCGSSAPSNSGTSLPAGNAEDLF